MFSQVKLMLVRWTPWYILRVLWIFGWPATQTQIFRWEINVALNEWKQGT